MHACACIYIGYEMHVACKARDQRLVPVYTIYTNVYTLFI